MTRVVVTSKTSGAKRILHTAFVIGMAVVLTLAFFLVLPVLQAINKGPTRSSEFTTIDTPVEPPPPPPIDEPEPEDEKPEEEPPPELEENPEPLDLDMLEGLLDGGISDGAFGADFSVNLNRASAASESVEELFSSADLDQRPRVVYQPAPEMTPQIRRKAPGTVYVIFIVDQDGRVTEPKVQRSSHPIFENAALEAVKKWKFEPGMRGDKAVSFRMRVPITFPKG